MSLVRQILLVRLLPHPLQGWRSSSSGLLSSSKSSFSSNSGDKFEQDKRTLYEVLGVEPQAEPKEIKDAFIRLSKEIHPDLNPHNKNANENFRKLAAAYEVLSDIKTRHQYDLESGIFRRKRNFRGGTAHEDLFKHGRNRLRRRDEHRDPVLRYGVDPEFGRKIDVDLSPERMAKAWEAYKKRWEMEEERMKAMEERKRKFREEFDNSRAKGFANMTEEEYNDLKNNMRCLRIPKSMLDQDLEKGKEDLRGKNLKREFQEQYDQKVKELKEQSRKIHMKYNKKGEEAEEIKSKRINLEKPDDEREEKKFYEEDPLLKGFEKDHRTRREYSSEYLSSAWQSQQETLKNFQQNWKEADFFGHNTGTIHKEGAFRSHRVEFRKSWVTLIALVFVGAIVMDSVVMRNKNSYDDNVYLQQLQREKEMKRQKEVQLAIEEEK